MICYFHFFMFFLFRHIDDNGITALPQDVFTPLAALKSLYVLFGLYRGTLSLSCFRSLKSASQSQHAQNREAIALFVFGSPPLVCTLSLSTNIQFVAWLFKTM